MLATYKGLPLLESDQRMYDIDEMWSEIQKVKIPACGGREGNFSLMVKSQIMTYQGSQSPKPRRNIMRRIRRSNAW